MEARLPIDLKARLREHGLAFGRSLIDGIYQAKIAAVMTGIERGKTMPASAFVAFMSGFSKRDRCKARQWLWGQVYYRIGWGSYNQGAVLMKPPRRWREMVKARKLSGKGAVSLPSTTAELKRAMMLGARAL